MLPLVHNAWEISPRHTGVTQSLPFRLIPTSQSTTNNVLDRKDIPGDTNAYIYRRADKGFRWHLYFYDRDKGNRHRFALRTKENTFPEATIKGQDQAWLLGVEKFIELKGKSDRGDAIKSLTFGNLIQQFLDKERKRISSIPQQGITKARYRLLENQYRWLRDYINDDKKQIHKLKRNAFLNYETWRKERAIEFKKEIPQQTTINQEMSCLRRVFSEVAVTHGFISKDTIPDIPISDYQKIKSTGEMISLLKNGKN